MSFRSATAQQWLDLIAVHHLKKLVYIDHGVGHQYLRVEFSSESACYTFLIRNDKKCTICATMLAREFNKLHRCEGLNRSHDIRIYICRRLQHFCRRFFNSLTTRCFIADIVTDVAKSSFRTVGVVPFTVDSIRCTPYAEVYYYYVVHVA